MASDIGLATHRDLEVRGPGDRRDDADSRSVVFEDGSLLDMELDEDVEVTADSSGSRPGIETDRAHGGGQRYPIGVAHAIDFAGLEPIGDRPRTPEVRVEAAPLLLADGETLKYSRRSAETPPEAADRFDPRDDAERSVERASPAHGVDVRTGRYDSAPARSFDPSPHIPDRVAPDEKAGFLHP